MYYCILNIKTGLIQLTILTLNIIMYLFFFEMWRTCPIHICIFRTNENIVYIKLLYIHSGHF